MPTDALLCARIIHEYVPRRMGINFGRFSATRRTAWRPVRDSFVPAYRLGEEAMNHLRAIERLDHQLTLSPDPGQGVLQAIRLESLARNAFATASIEGNPLSLDQVESLLRRQATPASTQNPVELEILNYVEFIQSREALQGPRIPDDIRRVHSRLFRGVLSDAGDWKRQPNFIGSSRNWEVVYVPAHPNRVVPELEHLLQWIRSSGGVHPIVRAALLHHEFESIHPFRDGNGRTGRALTPMVLRQWGYRAIALAPVDFLIHRDRSEYYAQLAAVERSKEPDYSNWVDFFLRLTHEAYRDAVDRSLFQASLPASFAARERSLAEWFAHWHRQNPTQWLKFSDIHQAFPEVPTRTLKRDVALLRDSGILDVAGLGKGTRYRLARAADEHRPAETVRRKSASEPLD
ncbi:MAG: Fic family protein [Thermoplasmatota archaeon]